MIYENWLVRLCSDLKSHSRDTPLMNRSIFLQGRGLLVDPVDGKLVATVRGILERVNKLLYIRPLKVKIGGLLGWGWTCCRVGTRGRLAM